MIQDSDLIECVAVDVKASKHLLISQFVLHAPKDTSSEYLIRTTELIFEECFNVEKNK